MGGVGEVRAHPHRGPEDIASIIREREVAVQDALKFEQQISQARSKAELGRAGNVAVQNQEMVAAETVQIRAAIAAMQAQSVALTAATQVHGCGDHRPGGLHLPGRGAGGQGHRRARCDPVEQRGPGPVVASQVRAFGTVAITPAT